MPAREMAVFHKLLDCMAGQPQKADLLKCIASCLVKELGFARAALYLANPDKKSMVQAIGADARGKYDLANVAEIPVSRQKGFSPFSDLLHGHSRSCGRHKNPAAGEVVYDLCLPIRAGKDEVIGVLAVAHGPEKSTASRGEASLLERFASQAGLMLEAVRLQEEVERLSVTDETTGLYNRQYFEKTLEKEIVRCQRYFHHCSLFCFRVDDLDGMTKRYGRMATEEVLRFSADYLKRDVRNIDTVARIEEKVFGVIFPELHPSDAESVARRILGGIQEIQPPILELEKKGEKVTLSVGLSNYPERANDAPTMIRKALQSLEAIKSTQANQIGSLL